MTLVDFRVHILGMADALANDEFNSAAHEVLDEIERHNRSGGDRRCKCLICKAPFTARQPASALVVLAAEDDSFAGAVCRQCLVAGNVRERVTEVLDRPITRDGQKYDA